jgi:hypothetical protein
MDKWRKEHQDVYKNWELFWKFYNKELTSIL